MSCVYIYTYFFFFYNYIRVQNNSKYFTVSPVSSFREAIVAHGSCDSKELTESRKPSQAANRPAGASAHPSLDWSLADAQFSVNPVTGEAFSDRPKGLRAWPVQGCLLRCTHKESGCCFVFIFKNQHGTCQIED